MAYQKRLPTWLNILDTKLVFISAALFYTPSATRIANPPPNALDLALLPGL